MTIKRLDLEKRLRGVAREIEEGNILQMCRAIAWDLGNKDEKSYGLGGHFMSKYHSKEYDLTVMDGNAGKFGSPFSKNGIYVLSGKMHVLRAIQIFSDSDEEESFRKPKYPIVDIGYKRYHIERFLPGDWKSKVEEIYNSAFLLKSNEIEKARNNFGWNVVNAGEVLHV